MKAILLFGPTSMHSLPCFTTGQDFLHSCRHFFGLHFSAVMMAIRVSVCSSLLSLVGFFLGGMMMMAHEKNLVRVACCGNNDENRVELGVRSCGSPLLVCLSMR